jgi:hypothetical protein
VAYFQAAVFLERAKEGNVLLDSFEPGRGNAQFGEGSLQDRANA